MSPASVERCVQALMKDPDFKPQNGRTKEESAWAVCTKKYQESQALADRLEKHKLKNSRKGK